MSALNRKLRRDLVGNAGLLATVVSIIAVGAGTFVGMASVQRILSASQAAYYRDYRFANFWIDLKKAPLTALERIAELPGVDEVRGRVVFDVILDMADEPQPVRGRLISAPAGDLSAPLNGIHLRRGAGFSPDRPFEVILGDAFAREHNLHPGDRISLLLNRRRETFTIVGTAISPEYVYMVSGMGDLSPDARHFGILFVPDRFARQALDFEGAANQVVGTFATTDPGRQAALLDRMERLLEPYGVLEVTPRERHASHRFVTDEIHGLRVNSVIIPAIFLTVAALVLNVLMSRLVERQRTIIGALKAIGYSNAAILAHFFAFATVVGVVGGLMAIGLGLLLVRGMLALYPTFFDFPRFLVDLYPDLYLAALAISVAVCALGAIVGARQALRLQPAEAMRPRPPARGGPIALERFGVLWRRLDFRTRMALRNVVRHRFRTGAAVFAAAISTAMILMTLMMRDAVFFLMDFQFELVSRADVTIALRDAEERAALFEARRLPGVDYAEASFTLVCDLRNGPRQRRIAVAGLPPDARLTTPRARNLTPIAIPPHGLVMSDKLADLLRVEVGQRVQLTPARGRRRTVQAPVLSIVASYLGLECYAAREYLADLVGETGGVTALQLAVNPAQARALFAEIKRMPNAQSLSVQANSRAAMETTFIETMRFTLTTLILLAGLIAFGAILNNTRVDIAERHNEIATFRTLGYSAAEIAAVFFRQNLLMLVLAVILGLPLGYGLALLIATYYNTELFRIPVVVRPESFASTAGLALIFVLCTQLLVYRQIRRLDWRSDIQVKE